MAPRRIVVKVGSSSLTSTDSDGATGIDDASVDALADAVADARDCGDEVVVVSSGAIAAGLAPLGLRRRPRDLATQQAAASAGQGLLVRRWSERLNRRGYPVGQVLLTVDDVTRRGHYRNAYRTFARLLELGAVPVVNENDTVATSEIRFGDIRLEVLHTPGHTEGSVCLVAADDGLIFSGDTLFAGAWGRVDLPGGDAAAMAESIARLAMLDDPLRVLPGHGAPTSIGRERPWMDLVRQSGRLFA